MMNEVKIAERIIVDEPENVVRAIQNLTGKQVDFELVQKFIKNEKNTIYYLDKKLNTSTEYGNYQDYIWLDTGFHDEANNPIMICLHNSYDGYVGHYTGPVRELANRVKSFNKKNMKDIEKNYSRFLSKYKNRIAARSVAYIEDEIEYAIDSVNKEILEQPETAFSLALKNLDLELAEEVLEEVEEPEDTEHVEEFTDVQNEITFDLVFEQMEKMQTYIDELLEHIENNEKESKEEIEALQAQNREYKRTIVQMRTFVQSEEKESEEEETTATNGHNLLGKNEKILILGNSDIRVAEMRAIARDYFGFEKTDFEFITDYEKVKKSGMRIHNADRFVAVIFGNCPHKVAGLGNYSSIIDEFKQREECPVAIDARNHAGGLKITKQSFKEALVKLCCELKEQNVA